MTIQHFDNDNKMQQTGVNGNQDIDPRKKDVNDDKLTESQKKDLEQGKLSYNQGVGQGISGNNNLTGK